jgi:adenosylcobinamide-phosphate synthase
MALPTYYSFGDMAGGMAGIVLVAALVADLLIGDPRWLPHPVVAIGRLISVLEALLLSPDATPKRKRVAGGVLVLLVVSSVYAAAAVVLYLLYLYSPVLFVCASIYIVWASISIKSLGTEARAVLTALETEGLESARARLSRIVGRDTAALSKEEVICAASETVAENSSDGVIAPLFYLAIGGPPLMIAYKAINTLDSMVGYRNEHYKDFGCIAARLDDIANYLPARLTAALMVVVSLFLRYDFRGAALTVLRDGRKHPSPNAGVVEAAVAGALNIRFGGPASYSGVITDKPYIGSGTTRATGAALDAAIRIMVGSALLMALSVTLARTLF